MAHSGCTLHETEEDLGACCLADEEHQDCRGYGSLDLKCERNEASSECPAESGAANVERSLGIVFREVEGEAHEEQGFEGGPLHVM